jgi:hypothetical protein
MEELMLISSMVHRLVASWLPDAVMVHYFETQCSSGDANIIKYHGFISFLHHMMEPCQGNAFCSRSVFCPAHLVAFVIIDFYGCWNRRLHIKLTFWNKHAHHSSEEFNLACALRQSILHL